jgi:transcriptional regulator with XRE-family HTH domain
MILARLRSEAGLTRAELAKAVAMSPSKITRIETLESGIYEKDLLKLLDFYQITGEERGELLNLVRDAKQPGWLQVYGNDAFPEEWQTWTELESDAVAVFNYETLLIPGLLQTPDYARAIIRATTPDLSDSEIDKLVASRMARQVRLSHSQPLELHVIIEKGALMRPFGDVRLQVDQLRHLTDFATRQNILIQVLPSEVGLHRALYGPFVTLEFRDRTRLVHLEAATSGVFLDEPKHVEAYTQIWDQLSGLAYNMEKSVDFISVITNQMREKI